LRAFIAGLPPSGESALFREQNPKSWWWTPDTDLLAGILFAVQAANWQRSGGKGAKPKPVTRPTEARKGRNAPVSRDELAARRQRLSDTQARNRERRVSGGD
jgi:hypothetical protein